MPDSNERFSRRRFVKGVGLTGMAATLGTQAIAKTPVSKPKGKKAKNLIFLVADGMGVGTYSLAHHWSLRQFKKPSNWINLYRHPGIRRALQDTASASSPVTDSAAAASAWGCGQRVVNGVINMDAAGDPLTPLYTYAKAAGKATGLVSTCRITHATPAGFVANTASRDLEDEIARQYLERGVDVLLGGGLEHFQRKEGNVDATDTSPIDLIPEFQSRGYSVAKDSLELANVSGSAKLLGLFSNSHFPYKIDRAHNAAFHKIPDLPSMFEAALKSLGSSRNGFALQVEAGRIDHTGHVNDPAAILHEQLEFERCIPIALDYLKREPDTLLIVTTDHGTGGCQLNGLGEEYGESGPALDNILSAKVSFEALESEFRASGKFDTKRFIEATGITPTEPQCQAMQDALEDETVEYLSSMMTATVSEQIMDRTAIGWTSNYHTAEHVDLFALGPGAELLPPFIQNNELFDVVMQAMFDKRVP